MVDEDEEGAKFALTEYAVMGQAGQEYAWVAARPVTGRTHQIRVHLASLGTPIVGDFKYGGVGGARAAAPLPTNCICMPAASTSAGPMAAGLQVTAPLPPHMIKSWQLLGFDPDDRRDPFETANAAEMRPRAPTPRRKAKARAKKKNSSREAPSRNDEAFLPGRRHRTRGGWLSHAAGWQAGENARPANLLLPDRALAEAIAEEWRAQGEEIIPATMPMLRLANTAQDGVAADAAGGDRGDPALRRA